MRRCLNVVCLLGPSGEATLSNLVFPSGLGEEESNQDVTKVNSLVKNGKNSTVYEAHLTHFSSKHPFKI